MTGRAASGLYFGKVFHRRLRPRAHALSYRVFYMLLDLDEVPALARRSRVFAHNRFGLFSFHDRDHGPGDGAPLRPWVKRALADAGIAAPAGRIMVLCLPRVLGYVFNPLTLYFCHDAEGGLAAMIYEVANTFGERHCYVVRVANSTAPAVSHVCDKAFYVSPFMEVAGRYHFKLLRPAERFSLTIRETDAGGTLFTASFAGKNRNFTEGVLLRAFLFFPLLTLKVVAGIHWEALKLWLKGVPLKPRPDHGPDRVTYS
ncbi:MAG: DUF1365 domain-containing protein [Parvibaculum sp.]|uniref:DUF1365 domain-containing protein n=1 Tax=Parvibaculum sp. TaxID=2024848 RepID=UPI0025E6CACB|nr:DUF1365 domain-containing protein [Parvibaculum sp.]MCE9649078.1 DUF1365 domain-containing protein [Parvibaculum sp.]